MVGEFPSKKRDRKREREKKGKKSTWSGDCISDEETVRNWDELWKEMNVPAETTGRL